jgi:hypothetical protein
VTSGTYKVTDTYLKDFATHEIQNFLDDAAKNPAMTALFEFANSVGGGAAPGNYDKILAGNGASFPPSQQLQTAFKTLVTQLRTQIQGLQDTMTKTQVDLQQVDYVLQNAEDSASLTAAEMMQDLQDVLGALNGSSLTNPPSTTP